MFVESRGYSPNETFKTSRAGLHAPETVLHSKDALESNISKENVEGVVLTGIGVGLVLIGINEFVHGVNDINASKIILGGVLIAGGIFCITRGLKRFKGKENPS